MGIYPAVVSKIHNLARRLALVALAPAPGPRREQLERDLVSWQQYRPWREPSRVQRGIAMVILYGQLTLLGVVLTVCFAWLVVLFVR
jgi:hypothetical protein